MARAEQVVTDRKTMREMIGFMEQAVKEGLSKEEIMSQIDLMLDKDAQKRLRQGQRDVKEGRVRHIKHSEDLLASLHASN